MKQPVIYILTNKHYGTLYVDVTSDLKRRIWQHREGITKGFTHAHGLNRLVWFEVQETMEHAIRREKLIKRWKRDWKIELIEHDNPYWADLYPHIST